MASPAFRARNRSKAAGRREPEDLSCLLGQAITRLKPGVRDPSRVSVFVGRRVVAVLGDVTAHRLRLKAGTVLDDQLADAIRASARRDRARNIALRRVERSACSRGGLLDALRKRGVEAELAAEVADDLVRSGLIDDERFAQDMARSILARKPAGRLYVEHKLRQKRVKPEAAREAARTAVEHRDAFEDALALARRRARTLPQRLDLPARRRRLFGVIARRGFDAQTARRAVDLVLGEQGACGGAADAAPVAEPKRAPYTFLPCRRSRISTTPF